MLDKIKWVVVVLILGSILYLNYQSEVELQKQINNSNKRIEKIKDNINGTNENLMRMSNRVDWKMAKMESLIKSFKEETNQELESGREHIRKSIKVFRDRIDLLKSSEDYDDEKLFKLLDETNALVDTIRIEDKKGNQSLKEQFDKLKLEFDELVLKLKTNRRTKNIWK